MRYPEPTGAGQLLSDVDLSRSERRLADELDELGVPLPEDPALARLMIEELDHSRHSPMFEGRSPMYGAIITADASRLDRWTDSHIDLVELSCSIREARTFCDGRAAYLVRDAGNPDRIVVACFDRFIQLEADVVQLRSVTDSWVVQHTPVFQATRFYGPKLVVSWNGRTWERRIVADHLLPKMNAYFKQLPEPVIYGVTELAMHWLAPTRIGATLIVDRRFDDDSFDFSGALKEPGFDLTRRHHRSPLMATLAQRDLATLIDHTGRVRALGVGLRVSGVDNSQLDGDDSMLANETADDNPNISAESGHGMRHRSAQQWSAGHPSAVVFVVSADGPVTVYQSGKVLLRT